MLAVTTLTLLASTRRGRGRRVVMEGPVRSVASALAVGGSPPVIVGLTSLDRASVGRDPFPERRCCSLIVGVIALTATAVAMASVDHLANRRELAGATWDAAVGAWDADGNVDIDRAVARAAAVPGVAAVTPGGWIRGALER